MKRDLAKRPVHCKACRVVLANPRRVGPFYCSPACAWSDARRRGHLRPPRTCLLCRKPFHPGIAAYGVQRYCSYQCGRAALRADSAEKGRRVPLTCAECGVGFTRIRALASRTKHGKHYCGRACAVAGRVGKKSWAWRGGTREGRGPGWLALAESIRARDEHTCRRCGKPQTQNGSRLHVDHVRPWRSFADKTLANDPANLVSLCAPCHAWKTKRAEARWLKGDVLELEAYANAVGVAL